MGCDCVRLRAKPEDSTPLNSQPTTSSNHRPKHRSAKSRDFELSNCSEQIRQLTKPLSTYYRMGAPEDERGSVREYGGEYINTGQKVTVQEYVKNSCSSIVKTKKKLMEEAERMYKLDHPHIMRLFELWEDDHSFYMISESLSGGSLEAYLSMGTALPEALSVTLLTQLLRTICYCHAQGVSGMSLNPKRIWLKDPPGTAPPTLKISTIETLTPAAKAKSLSIDTPSLFSAPEEFTGNMSEKSDVWTCGMFFTVLLTQKPMFPSKKYSAILAGNKRFLFPFTADQWQSVSAEAKALVSSMLTYDAKARPSALECLSSPYLAPYVATSQLSSKQVKDALSNLKASLDSNPLKKAVKKLIITRGVRLPQVEALTDCFLHLDSDHNGYVGTEEIRAALEKVMSKSQAAEETDQIMRNVGKKATGHISYTTFLACSYNERQLLSEENTLMAFNMFDRDRSGQISMTELRAILSISGKNKEQSWIELMKMMDVSGDGEIDYREFVGLMKKGGS